MRQRRSSWRTPTEKVFRTTHRPYSGPQRTQITARSGGGDKGLLGRRCSLSRKTWKSTACWTWVSGNDGIRSSGQPQSLRPPHPMGCRWCVLRSRMRRIHPKFCGAFTCLAGAGACAWYTFDLEWRRLAEDRPSESKGLPTSREVTRACDLGHCEPVPIHQ